MAGINDDVVLRLILKGQEPGEAARMIGLSTRAIEAELNASIARQSEAFRRAAEAQTAEARKQAKAEIKEHQDKTKAIVQAIKEVERTQTASWRTTLNDLKNVTVVAAGAWSVISGGAGRLKALGDSIATTTNIYGSLKGSIDSMREASKGQIADIDLITTKNRAAQKELQLTDEQFGLVAASADSFADALGTSTKEALDGLIDGLATGRLKSLAMAGVMVNQKQVLQEYADELHKPVEALSEMEERTAKLQAALRAMDKKLAESGGSVASFADEWEQANAKITNLGDEMKLGLGAALVWVVDKFDALTNTVLEFGLMWNVTFAQLRDAANRANPFADKTDYAGPAKALLQGHLQAVANVPRDRAAAQAAEAAARQDRIRRDQNPTMADLEIFGGKGLPYRARPGSVGGDTTPGKTPKTASSPDNYLTKVIDELVMRAEIARANQLNRDKEALAGALHLEELLARMEAGDNVTPEEIKEARMYAPEFHGGRYTAGEQGQYLKAQASAKSAYEARTARDLTGIAAQTAAQQAGESAEKFKAGVQSAVDKAGGGILGNLLFGPGGLNKSFEQMDAFEKRALELADTMSSAGAAMAGAIGESAAAALAGEKSFGAALREGTRSVLKSLSAQAIVKGLMATAEGFAKLSNPLTAPLAAADFKAAAAFAAVGVAAGLGARALGPGSSSATGETPAISRGPSIGSGGTSRSVGGSGETNIINLNVTLGFGSKEEATRGFIEGIRELERQTGKKYLVAA